MNYKIESKRDSLLKYQKWWKTSIVPLPLLNFWWKGVRGVGEKDEIGAEVIKKFEYKRLSVTKYEFLVYFLTFSSGEVSKFYANSSLFVLSFLTDWPQKRDLGIFDLFLFSPLCLRKYWWNITGAYFINFNC